MEGLTSILVLTLTSVFILSTANGLNHKTSSSSEYLQRRSHQQLYHLSAEEQLRTQLSQKFAQEMQKYMQKIRYQATVTNRQALIRTLKRANFYNAAASFGYMTSIVLQIHVVVYGRTYATLGDVLDTAGRAVEEAAFDAEGFLSVKDIDTGCLNNLPGLESNFNLEGQFQNLESSSGGGGYVSKEAAKENLILDITDFKTDFQEKLSCILTSDIPPESQRLLGLLDLYIKAANKRVQFLP